MPDLGSSADLHAALVAGVPLDITQDQWSALEAAYAQPPRAYHHLGHVHEVLHHYTAVAAGPGWAQPVEVCLAVLYHDAIYRAGRHDNEERSAELAVQHILRWMPQAHIDTMRVASLIRLTARHGQISEADIAADPAPADLRHFLDCDMAILGAKPEVFDTYDRAIAAEYRGVVPLWWFKLKRRAFLQQLLASDRIYLSEFFQVRLEAQARANLRRAIAGKR